MSNVQEDILEWLHQRPDWLQLAAEQLLSSGHRAEVDIQAITDCLKTPDGQQVTTNRTFDALTQAPDPAAELRLAEIGDITGIENLAPRRPLNFGTGNLAVVYGHNGSGKSGYTRILKRLCGKPRASDLKPNVYEAPPANRQCRVDYKLAGAVKSVVWQPDGAPVDDLRAVDVFDAHEASFYLSNKTETSYTPPSIALFEELATVCDQVRETLLDEQSRLASKLPDLPERYTRTTAGSAYQTLSADLSEDDIQRLTAFPETDEAKLDKLNKRLATVDPASSAARKRDKRRQIEGIIMELKAADSAVSLQGVGSIRSLHDDASIKRQTATESSPRESARLEGTGTDTWNALWEAAREHSRTVYPGEDYPVTTDDARCVLCHQELPPDVRQRLRDFEAFTHGAVEAEARRAESSYQRALDVLPAIPTEAELRTRCAAAGLTEEEWVARLGAFWAEAAAAYERLRSAEWESVALESPSDLVADLTRRADVLGQSAREDDADAASFDREQTELKRLNLEGRRWIAQQAVAIKAEIARLRSVREYEKWKRLANSRPISIKIRQIAERVITQAYVDRFNKELKKLSASSIRVELVRAGASKGRVLHQLRLKGTQTGEDLPASVLSEGERRVVALAAFLASVAEKPRATPFIFDDPISSLDQHFEGYVARRLADLAKTRQVLVFTHRLSLYGEMEEAANKIGAKWKKAHLEQRYIESFSGVAGQPADESARNVNTKKANNILLDRLREADAAGKREGGDAYRMRAQGICTDLRILLERTVEDDLLNQVVRRHRRSVTTSNRLAPLASITEGDVHFIDELMTKYSSYEHSQPSESPISIPEEPELRADLESLKVWREKFKGRA